MLVRHINSVLSTADKNVLYAFDVRTIGLKNVHEQRQNNRTKRKDARNENDFTELSGMCAAMSAFMATDDDSENVENKNPFTQQNESVCCTMSL